MTMSAEHEKGLAELRTEWHNARAGGDTERLADIEDEAARITALSVVLAVFPDAVVVEPPPMTDTEDRPAA